MRRKVLSGLAVLILLSFSHRSYSQVESVKQLKFSGGAMVGYNRGLGLQTNVTASNFAPEFPFKLRFGLGYTFLNPGDALDARRIFINNNTNGTPEKHGRSIDLRLNLLISKTVFNINHSYIVFGPRFSAFKGDFKYVGGNEDFEVKSHQWGIGAGIENHFKMTQNLGLIIAYGLDFYIPSTLTGHDTSYSPDNDNINPTRDNQNDNVYFLYKDANRAIRQPEFMPFILLGVSFGL
jgi:hypothetical protein